MKELLDRLLNRLEGIGKRAEELYDTECQQRMRGAVMNGFVRGIARRKTGEYDAIEVPSKSNDRRLLDINNEEAMNQLPESQRGKTVIIDIVKEQQR
jgi:hypothetical protein